MVERGPRKSGREEFGEMRGREGFWIGWEEAARDEKREDDLNQDSM